MFEAIVGISVVREQCGGGPARAGLTLVIIAAASAPHYCTGGQQPLSNTTQYKRFILSGCLRG